jgi:polyisoprenoid-binding protein YceI
MLRARALLMLLVLLTSARVGAADYQFDPRHTRVRFEIDQLWWFTQHGGFDRTRGTLEYDVGRQTGSLDVVIDAGSLDTGNDERDTTLKGADWFDVGHHPSITFHGQRFVFEQGRLTAVEGELTMLGVTQPIRLTVERIQCGANPDTAKQRCRADASGTLQRSRFGMRSSLPLIGDEVRLRIQAEAYLKP